MSAESNLTKAVEDFDFTEVKQKEDNIEVLLGVLMSDSRNGER
jgi:hypothetical protein